jgi:ferric-dicitrate binding protein FerR (iron transport regulator)
MNRRNFDILLDKYLTDTCTPDEKKAVEQWYALLDNPDLRLTEDVQVLKNVLWSKIEKNIQPQTPIVPIWRKPIFIYMAAASVLLLVSICLYIFGSKEITKFENTFIADNSFIKQKNTSDKVISLILEDSSKVDLQPNAEISYPKHFETDKREVTLTGEAFFSITKNPTRPFLVYAKGTITKVLGTSFTVQALEKDKKVTVLVKTGKVSVYTAASSSNKQSDTDPETQGIVLTPNQKAVFDLKTDNIQKEIVEKPSILIPLSKTEDFTFSDAPVTDIFENMEKVYGIDLIYDEELLKNCTLTTSLTDVPMFDKLKIICSAIGAKYKEIDAHIVITAKGCD